MGELDTVGAPGEGERDQVVDGVDVGPVQHDVQTEWQSCRPHQPCGALLGGERAGSRDAFGGLGIGVLYGELDTAQSRVQQLREPSLVQGHTAGDELGVEARGVGGGHDPGEIAPEEGFAAGQVGLDNAQVS